MALASVLDSEDSGLPLCGVVDVRDDAVEGAEGPAFFTITGTEVGVRQGLTSRRGGVIDRKGTCGTGARSVLDPGIPRDGVISRLVPLVVSTPGRQSGICGVEEPGRGICGV